MNQSDQNAKRQQEGMGMASQAGELSARQGYAISLSHRKTTRSMALLDNLLSKHD